MSTNRNRRNGFKIQTNIKEDNLLAYIALGFFDGIHLGHQALLKYCVKKAKEDCTLSTVILF